MKFYACSGLVEAFLQAENVRFVMVMRIANTKYHFGQNETSPGVGKLYHRTSLLENLPQRQALGHLSYSSLSNKSKFFSATVFVIKFSMNKNLLFFEFLPFFYVRVKFVKNLFTSTSE